MKLKEAIINAIFILCCLPLVVLYNKIKSLNQDEVFLLDESEKSSYLRTIMIGCLSIVLCCIMYIMILMHFNIKLMLFLLSKVTGKNFDIFNDIISRLIDIRMMHYIALHIHLKSLDNILHKNELESESRIYKDFASKTNLIIKSIEHHRKLYEKFILPT
ncbi:putative integral membrane protein [Ehrlichia ruminantium]|uniref:Putative integral membrane protein n=1 Tax=Ehrlichia ruminantium TaxID=779 RepID=A0A170TQR8_EHRRU|nr:hypothetical protein [Ehrlichia ruminantium]GAT76848.1 putative integral membrane protein [Ehrlichia ruminantium]GAT77852.1 putative integral membrane protein [Ehrlichia ruminantium]GAT79046.1 putative integral membrane protein [Ehrlichia ruminantium]